MNRTLAICSLTTDHTFSYGSDITYNTVWQLLSAPYVYLLTSKYTPDLDVCRGLGGLGRHWPVSHVPSSLWSTVDFLSIALFTFLTILPKPKPEWKMMNVCLKDFATAFAFVSFPF